MIRRFRQFLCLLSASVWLAVPGIAAKPKIAKLAKKLLYGDQSTRMDAIKTFNKMPVDAQYNLVPDFMVALSDDDPEVRKIASRILKAMGLTGAAEVPDAKKELPTPASKISTKQELADEKTREEAAIPDIRKKPVPQEELPAIPVKPTKPAGQDPWGELKQMRGDEAGQYADLKREIDREKKGQVTLDVAELQSDSASSLTPLSTVIVSLKDPDPWVRSQAARRLAMVRPAPVETIPTLIDMLSAKDVESRLAAAAALGSFGSLAREAIPALTKALGDSDNSVSLIAAEALKQIQQR